MIPAPQYDDDAARRRIRESLGESLLVEASAGTGKTSELIRRMVRVLAGGLGKIDRIVAVTFTNKAAGELKLRLRQELDRARTAAADDMERNNLEDALERLEEASIGTIHAFCAQILRERPAEAVVDPSFEELTPPEAEHLYQHAFRSWLQARLGEESPGLRRAYERLACRDSYDERTPTEVLQYAGRELIEWRDFTTPWRREPFARQQDLDALVEQARALFELRKLPSLGEFLETLKRADSTRTRDYDSLEALLLKLQRDVKREHVKAGGLAHGVNRQDARRSGEEFLAALESFRRRAEADLAALLRSEMCDLIERYTEAKRRVGKLDFLDLLLLARDLVRRDAVVRAYLQDRFTHIFVDEFQDTDPLQAELLLLLAADNPRESNWLEATPLPGKLFLVGDPKQSVYKFRRADIALYQAVRDALTARGVGLVYLTKSYRSARPIQQCVNAAFAPLMTGNAAERQAHYAPLEEHLAGASGQPNVVVVPAPHPYGKRDLANYAIEKCLPDALVAFVEWLLKDSGWQVRDPEQPEQFVSIAARHVCLLFRRFINNKDDVTRAYVRSLEARGIAHLLVGSKSFHRREEVETLRSALTAVEWPDDELSVFAALKGSLFSVSDGALLRYRHEIGHLDPFGKRPDAKGGDFQPIVEALDVLAGLHRERNRRPLADTVNLLLEAARAHVGFALRPAGHQALANVYRIADLARAFETGGGLSFRGFVEELAVQAAKVEQAEAPVVEEGAEGVRIMTVHTAKGLEFPVVVLADMTCGLSRKTPERHVDAQRGVCAQRLIGCAPWELLEHEQEEIGCERAEGIRVAYVAATRARDLLVIPGVGDGEREGWVAPLNKAAYPVYANRRRAQLAPGCPPFGNATVLERPTLTFGDEESIKPGLHAAQQGEHRIVWWDPAALRLGVEGSFGIRQEEILAESPHNVASIAQYEAWRESRQQTLAQGVRPQFDVLTASEAGAPPLDFSCQVDVESVSKPPGRPFGPRFGAMVHAILSEADFAGGRAQVAALAATRGRLFGASRAEVDAAIDAVTAALSHPLLSRALAADRMHRELPVMVNMGEGRILEGIIDLAFFEAGSWHVVDFKTDADLPARVAHYRVQLQWYALALQKLTGGPVKAWLLSV